MELAVPEQWAKHSCWSSRGVWTMLLCLGGSIVEPGVGPDGPCGSFLTWDVLSFCEQLADGMGDLCCSCWLSVQKESGGFK